MANEFDIVIVGGGLVGASLACALGRTEAHSGPRVAVVEPGPPPASYGERFDPRVVALTRSSQRFLSRLGVWDSIISRRACPYSAMVVWDGEGSAEIEFDSAELGEPDLGHIVENSAVLQALLERLSHFPNISFLRGCKVQQLQDGFAAGGPQASTLVLDNDESLGASLVLAADGGQSKIRELLAMESREWDYGQDAIVTTVRSEHSHQFTAWQRFSHAGPLAFLPLCGTGESRDSHYSSIVWSLQRERAAELMTLDDAEFARELGAGFEHRLGEILEVDKRYSFALRQRHAVNYVRPGFGLVGDAAHTIHPLAGQGVNLGLADAEVIAGEIQRAIQRQIPLTDYSILRRYQRARKGANLGMMALMEAFKRLFGSDQPSLHLLRNLGMRQVNGLGPLKNSLARQAMGL